ncbi:hypothetical protein [Methylorubrum zatmanii]|uniref:Uncharacterized protein n=1 Tax=Methylorubrum zatmanii TaxID=29429 RepID=A0ABW1WSV5_9HYPH|nr:hypothetical protein [Methylorubrum zatmanii]
MNSGVWVGSIYNVPARARDLYASAFSKTVPFSWYAVASLGLCDYRLDGRKFNKGKYLFPLEISCDAIVPYDSQDHDDQPEDIDSFEGAVLGNQELINRLNSEIRERSPSILEIGEFQAFAKAAITIELHSPMRRPEFTPLPVMSSYDSDYSAGQKPKR